MHEGAAARLAPCNSNKSKEIAMRTSSHFASIASCAAVAALLAGCTLSRTVYVPPQPTVAVAPAVVTPAPVVVTPASLEFGRVTNLEYFPRGMAASRINIPGAIVGGVAGAVIGNQVGRAVGGRDAATVLGGAAGAAIGSQVATSPTAVDTGYRVTIHTDAGMLRTYDVPTTGDLRVGDRVRIENGMIYRS
jgi:outer membrane lipoprotein SlyB